MGIGEHRSIRRPSHRDVFAHFSMQNSVAIDGYGCLKREIPTGTLRAMIEQLELEAKDFGLR